MNLNILEEETNNNRKDGGEETPIEEDAGIGLRVTVHGDTTGQDPPDGTEFSEAQDLFRTQLNSAMRKLFGFLEIEYEASLTHR